MTHKPLTGLYVMDPARFDDVYGPDERIEIEHHLTIEQPPCAAEDLSAATLRDVEVLVTGWGAPRLTADFLDRAPRLRLVLYAAGSVRPLVTDASWERGIRISSAGTVIADKVADFALSQILYALKHGWRYVLTARRTRSAAVRLSEPGTAGATVGLVSLGATGRATARLLLRHGVRVLAHDPYVPDSDARALGVEPATLNRVFAECDVVSLHAPLIDETRGMVDARLLRSMRLDATLVNTARGGLVDEAALVTVLRERPDLFAVLDVTDPEPPRDGSPLFQLDNVVVTPHLAGSLGPERRMLGQAMAEELSRYIAGRPLRHEVVADAMEHAA
ncbi:hydroxyacid dehydrogenase [Streptomyces echinatus]|uniref:Phosphoglycerate dehydrogenase-like enzyme n=1 Tax=Streptomyces echinatus TaxID=67293 RepID=A0A7W9UNT8_9ACTN|nr:hydroxyacid dehydrogenase [Streptomyces echinatus]MBB5925635.1 phosphoglycerate dehydrogenase-like enzyme [Streptomyces echinatus]